MQPVCRCFGRGCARRLPRIACDFPSRNMSAIVNITPPSAPRLRSRCFWCSPFGGNKDEDLLQSIDFADQAAEFRPIKQVVDFALAWEKFLCQPARRRGNLLSLLVGHVALSDDAQRKIDDDP